MLQQPIHMRDQVTNRIEIIMQDNKPSIFIKAEEFSVAALLVLVFVIGLSI
jgi:hypothetical protein